MIGLREWWRERKMLKRVKRGLSPWPLLGDHPLAITISEQMIALAVKCKSQGNMDDFAKVEAFLHELLADTDSDQWRAEEWAAERGYRLRLAA